MAAECKSRPSLGSITIRTLFAGSSDARIIKSRALALNPLRVKRPIETADDELMASYVGGDVTAFETLYERYERKVYSFCLRLLGERDAAADAFQETFVRLVDNRSLYEPQGRFASWLFTVARRVCTDALRARSSAKRAELSDWSASDPPRTEEIVEQRDEIVRLMAIIPPEQREVLLLHRYFGFSYREIANMTESTEAAVKQKAYRALRAVRKAGTSE